jgi:organic radical activating enzyme
LHRREFAIAVETNGTIAPPLGLDWVCVSPKAGAPLVVVAGDELKVVVPQPGLDPLAFGGLDFRRFSVQPMDGPERTRNTETAIEFCLRHPQWQLSLQTHKITGIR